MLLMIDNYDSFTYNLVQYLGELGAEVQVHRNDQIDLGQIERMNPSRIVISPGPCTPNEAGVSMDVVKRFGGRIPLLGVCLGHQCIGQVYGGTVQRAKAVMHGKTSLVHHEGEGVFAGLPQPFEATRYHSLIVDDDGLSKDLHVSAWSTDAHGNREEIMGLRDPVNAVEGVQFHPESILTKCGHDLLRNFLELSL